MQYSSKTIANYFLSKSFETGVELSPMKLIKLVYLAHGWSLGINGEELISEAVQAWQYGPVIESLYREFKRYGNSPITALIVPPPPIASREVDKETAEFLDSIWSNYSDLTASQLSALTHEKGSPWSQIWHDEGGKDERGRIIPNATIRSFYQKKLDEAR